AKQEAAINAALSLSSTATKFVDDRLSLALLLGLQANGVADTEVAPAKRSFMRDIATANPRLWMYLRSPAPKTSQVAFSPDGRLLAAAGSDGTIAVWEFGEPPRLRP